MNEKPQVVRSPEPRLGARETEERRRVAEIAREVEELGRALEGRDRLRSLDAAERAESWAAHGSTSDAEPPPIVGGMSNAPKEASAQIGKFAKISKVSQQDKPGAVSGPRRRKRRRSLAAAIIAISLASGGALILMGSPIEIAQAAYRRAGGEMQRLTVEGIEIAQDAYRSAVAEMQRLTARENTEIDVAGRKATEERALAEEAQRKAAEEKVAAETAARREEEEARQKERAEAAREMAQARATAQEATQRKAAEDALKLEEAARKAPEGMPKPDAKARDKAEKAEVALKLSEQDRKRVQVALNSLGHKIPAVTGYFGQRTREMITAWQKTQALPETGYLTEAQLATLRQQAAAALAKYDQAERRSK